MSFHFELVTPQNTHIANSLHIAPHQKDLVESVSQCLSEAKQFSLWHPCILYKEDTPIGFAMFGLWKDQTLGDRVWLDRFFIDQRYQGKGYAKGLFDQLLHHIKNVYGCKKIYLSVFETNVAAISLYEKFGFAFTGELDIGGEKVMVKSFAQ